MFIVSVLPISRNLKHEELTYFSSQDFKNGTLVEVPLRNKKIQGIVLYTKDASELKAEIKKLPYEIKKIDAKKNSDGILWSLPEYIIKSIEECASYFASSFGQIIASFMPEDLFETIFKTNLDKKIIGEKFEEFLIQTNTEERETIIKGIVREVLGKKESVHVFSPTTTRAKKLFEILSKGVESKSILLTSPFNKKELNKLNETLNESPTLIIQTPNSAGFLRNNASTIIVDDESSRFYKLRRKPFPDARKFLKIIAKNKKIRIFYSDELPRMETVVLKEKNIITEFIRSREKIVNPIQTLVVDIKKEEFPKPYEILSKDLRELLKYADIKNKKVFIYASRKGVAPQTICLDCKESVLCEKCHSPIVLHKKDGEFVFICHHCGGTRTAKETCKKCGGWNLKAFGVGTEKVQDEVRSLIKKEKVFLIDADTVKNQTSAEKIIKKFMESGTVLIGTEMALQQIGRLSVDYVAIASIDSLLSIPDFSINEKIIKIIISLKEICTNLLLVQTRRPQNEIIEMGLEGNVGKFIKSEMETRKELGFPPFKKFIKISMVGKKDQVFENAQKIQESTTDIDQEIEIKTFPAFIPTIKGNFILHVLISVSESFWPNEKLSKFLMSLPPSIRVEIDPESLL